MAQTWRTLRYHPLFFLSNNLNDRTTVFLDDNNNGATNIPYLMDVHTSFSGQLSVSYLFVLNPPAPGRDLLQAPLIPCGVPCMCPGCLSSSGVNRAIPAHVVTSSPISVSPRGTVRILWFLSPLTLTPPTAGQPLLSQLK